MSGSQKGEKEREREREKEREKTKKRRVVREPQSDDDDAELIIETD